MARLQSTFLTPTKKAKLKEREIHPEKDPLRGHNAEPTRPHFIVCDDPLFLICDGIFFSLSVMGSVFPCL